MKKTISLLTLSFSLLTLTGCFLFTDDGSWKEEYGSPELFLQNVSEEHRESIFKYASEGEMQDTDFQVKKAILASSPFKSVKKKEPVAERYFTYQAYWIPATSGPNYCQMSIWDDGFIRIDHKSSLGPHGYAYFQMDADKAVLLNDLVFSLFIVDNGGIE